MEAFTDEPRDPKVILLNKFDPSTGVEELSNETFAFLEVLLLEELELFDESEAGYIFDVVNRKNAKKNTAIFLNIEYLNLLCI